MPVFSSFVFVKERFIKMPDKVNYKNFANTDIVGSLERTLLLDKSQFTGLPSDTLEVTRVNITLVDREKQTQDMSNVRKFDVIGRDIKALKQMQDTIKKMPKSTPPEIIDAMLSSVPDNVDIRVDITNRDGSLAENAQANYDFFVRNDLISEGKGVVLTGIDYGVTWEYATAYKDKLSLRATDLSNVTVKRHG